MNEESSTVLGGELQQIRKEKKISPGELASRSGLHRTYIGFIHSMKRER